LTALEAPRFIGGSFPNIKHYTVR